MLSSITLPAEARHVRLLVQGPAAGVWNMAVDEALLQAAARERSVVMRLYQWQEATLSLGYFQSHADRQQHPASLNCPLVRRQTGGGAIVHDRELTYSLCIPPAHPLASETQLLYDVWHETLIAALADHGVAARRCPQASGLAKGDEPFLCFQRRAKGDILAGDAKITGSAQRRSHGAVLQHGSILLETSSAAPELTGIAELAGATLSPVDLTRTWTETLERKLRLSFNLDDLRKSELDLTAQLAEEKYGAESWTKRR